MTGEFPRQRTRYFAIGLSEKPPDEVVRLTNFRTKRGRHDEEKKDGPQGEGTTELTVLGEGIWPHHQVYINGQPLETRYISTEELRALLPAEMVSDVGMYKVTVRSIGEPNPESSPAPLVVGFH